MTALASVCVMPGRVLVLTPSRGLGGGIERYVEALEWAFADQGVKYGRLDLRGAGAVLTPSCWPRPGGSCARGARPPV